MVVVNIKHIIRLFILNYLFLIYTLPVISQKSPVKFGKVDKSSLEMNVYPGDTSAEAVILCDYGKFNPIDFLFTRTIRIKILKKEGYYWANAILPTPAKSDVKGITYNLENDEIKIDKLKNESIFLERVTENLYRTRITMPNVRVGSIVDIQISFPGLPIEWRFQELIPVVWSELILPPTQYVEFQKKFVGYEPLHISETYRWVGKDMPAFKSEPYINSSANYLTKFEIEISNIHVPGYYYGHFTGSWQDVNQFFLTSEKFGQLISNPGLYLNNDIRIIKEKDLTDEEKIRQTIDLVKEKIKWDKNNRVFPSYELGYIYRTRNIGNAADINITLITGLRKLGFKVYPAILSARDNGYINPFWPTVDKFNYVVAFLELNGKEYFLDATEKNNPAGLLPERCLNGQAFIIDEFDSRWIDLPLDKADIKKINGNFELLQTGELKGKITFIREQYAAVRFRDKYMEYNSLEEYQNNFEKENPGVLVRQCTIQNIDSIYKSVIDEYEISIINRTSVIGDLIYLEPLLFLKITDNPFKPEKRIYPVDYAVPSDEMIMVNILLPEGFSVEELPGPAMVVLPDKTTEFTFMTNDFNSSVQITCRLKINKAVFTQMEYPNLREFYNLMITKQSEPVIIKKE